MSEFGAFRTSRSGYQFFREPARDKLLGHSLSSRARFRIAVLALLARRVRYPVPESPEEKEFGVNWLGLRGCW